jgi:NAD(P)-dependent dehydrogenase (short-subunit alcohol dehydrogenase family)
MTEGELSMPAVATGNEHNDDDGLANRVAIVTGASADADDGITNGRAAALVLGKSGVKVVCVGRRLGPVERTADLIEKAGGTSIALAGDVSDEADCRQVVESTLRAFGRLDFLDNNVGQATAGDVVNTDIDIWRESWRINVESQILMSKFAIPAMKSSDRGGAIVNIGSLRALHRTKRRASLQGDSSHRPFRHLAGARRNPRGQARRRHRGRTRRDGPPAASPQQTVHEKQLVAFHFTHV